MLRHAARSPRVAARGRPTASGGLAGENGDGFGQPGANLSDQPGLAHPRLSGDERHEGSSSLGTMASSRSSSYLRPTMAALRPGRPTITPQVTTHSSLPDQRRRRRCGPPCGETAWADVGRCGSTNGSLTAAHACVSWRCPARVEPWWGVSTSALLGLPVFNVHLHRSQRIWRNTYLGARAIRICVAAQPPPAPRPTAHDGCSRARMTGMSTSLSSAAVVCSIERTAQVARVEVREMGTDVPGQGEEMAKFMVLYRSPVSAEEQMAGSTPEQARQEWRRGTPGGQGRRLAGRSEHRCRRSVSLGRTARRAGTTSAAFRSGSLTGGLNPVAPR